MVPQYFDAHSHLNFQQFDEDREKLIARMEQDQVWTICVGTGLETSKESVALAEEHKHIFATVGVHPTDWEEGFDVESYKSLAGHKKVIAIGECGLDYFRDHKHTDQQKELFQTQVHLAHELELPLMIHGRPSAGTMDAYEDILEILKTNSQKLQTDNPGNVHFFVGDIVSAQQFLDLGFTLSFDGPITFTSDYDDVVRYIPLDMILAETDAPFAAPEPYRGKRNEPAFVKEVVRAIARIKNENEEKVREQLVMNVLRVFNITV